MVEKSNWDVSTFPRIISAIRPFASSRSAWYGCAPLPSRMVPLVISIESVGIWCYGIRDSGVEALADMRYRLKPPLQQCARCRATVAKPVEAGLVGAV